MSLILSPWLAQLQERRPFTLEKDAMADVAIVGAGIAGVSTAAMILKETNLSVVLVEAGRIAHGATGHNAGQLAAEFERPFPQIVEQYGEAMASAGHAEIEGAWDILDDLFKTFSLRTPFYVCPGFLGYETNVQIRSHLDDTHIRSRNGLYVEPLMIAVGSSAESVVTEQDEKFVTRVPHNVILERLRTEEAAFVAAAITRRGCMNSALFSEELVGSLIASHPTRLSVAEHLPVTDIVLEKTGAVLHTNGATIRAKHVVLCTNGFETLSIRNEDGPSIDRSFHRLVEGLIGYMGGYIHQAEEAPLAVVYLRDQRSYRDPYFYITRRPYETAGTPKTLICIGGPERTLPNGAAYDHATPFPADIEEEIDRAFHGTYRHEQRHGSERTFLWHGLMGYTPSGVRCVGKDPRNTRLLYNLGCNGIGLLPSISGAKRIAHLLAGKELKPSIFDPAVQMQ